MGAKLLKLFKWYANKPKLVFPSLFVNMGFCAVLFSWAEDFGIWTSLWWSLVTASTVGYGDYFAVTTPGRIVSSYMIISTIWIMAPLVIVHFFNMVYEDRNEFTHEEQEEMKQALRSAVAALQDLTTSWQDNIFTEDEQRKIMGNQAETHQLLRQLVDQTGQANGLHHSTEDSATTR